MRPSCTRLLLVLGALAGALASGCEGESFFPSGDGSVWDWTPAYYDGGGVPPPQCQGQESTVKGTVYAPNSVDPVPGATVFIPSVLPEMFTPAVKCEVCGHMGGANNFWTTVSTADGKFTLNGVCPGKWNLVLQNGRFRRLVEIQVPAKTTLFLSADKTRLPRRNKEQHSADAIPKIAVATGDFDKMECVLRKMGIEDASYFHLYEGALTKKSPSGLQGFDWLVNRVDEMKKYNIIFINCTANTYESELAKSGVRQNLLDYVQSGGRLYVTDWSYDWVEQVEGFAPFIDFEPGASGTTPEAKNAAALGADGLTVQGTIKQKEMSDWLANFSGAISGGKSKIEHFLVNWVMMHKLGQGVKLWVEGSVSSQDNSISGVKPLTVTFTFKNCGKILYTSYHTEGRDNEILPLPFPQYCGSGMTAQDRILEYLIFDIASCIKPVD